MSKIFKNSKSENRSKLWFRPEKIVFSHQKVVFEHFWKNDFLDQLLSRDRFYPFKSNPFAKARWYTSWNRNRFLEVSNAFRWKGRFHPVLCAFLPVQTQQSDALRFQILNPQKEKGYEMANPAVKEEFNVEDVEWKLISHAFLAGSSSFG